ncbi:uncharacterized protein LOC104450022 [Eucalyptus grandis]|nr:uncharacterized protein LOC104450022 [Eucalyptus grandis]
MASACVNTSGISPDSFPPAAYGWLSPRTSLSRDFPDGDPSPSPKPIASPPRPAADPPEGPEPSAPGDFEFCLKDPVAMLPADELFSDGKIVPLQFSAAKPSPEAPEAPPAASLQSPENSSERSRRIKMNSSRWKELLCLKKLYQNQNPKRAESTQKSTQSTSKSVMHFLHRSSKSTSDASNLSLPLLRESSDGESVSISSRHSLSSSSSSNHELEDLHRLSLDSDKPNPNLLHKNGNAVAAMNVPRMRLVKPRADNPKPSTDHHPAASRAERSPMRRSTEEPSGGLTNRGVTADSPRLNASGKVVFYSLERSSSSPSSYGGPRFKYRGVERSYSAGVRVSPVLNVPISSIKAGSVFGLGQLFSSSSSSASSSSHSQQKREGNNGRGSSGGRNQPSNGKNRSERS